MPETFDVFIVINSNGDYAIGVDYDTAVEAYDNEIGGGAARRIVHLTVRASIPAETDQTTVNVPDNAGTLLEADSERPTESSYPNG